jgi:hypothetical protein
MDSKKENKLERYTRESRTSVFRICENASPLLKNLSTDKRERLRAIVVAVMNTMFISDIERDRDTYVANNLYVKDVMDYLLMLDAYNIFNKLPNDIVRNIKKFVGPVGILLTQTEPCANNIIVSIAALAYKYYVLDKPFVFARGIYNDNRLYQCLIGNQDGCLDFKKIHILNDTAMGQSFVVNTINTSGCRICGTAQVVNVNGIEFCEKCYCEVCGIVRWRYGHRCYHR